MRRGDWLDKLWTEIESAAGQDFAWGEHDCCLFAARCVDAMTDGGIAAELRAEYHDKPSALRYIARHGSLKAAITDKLGEPTTWWKIGRGDLCLVPSEDGLGSLGVCLGPTIACVLPDKGLQYEPLDRATACWKIA